MDKLLERHKLSNLTKEIEIVVTDRSTEEIPSLYGFTGKCLQTFKEAVIPVLHKLPGIWKEGNAS